MEPPIRTERVRDESLMSARIAIGSLYGRKAADFWSSDEEHYLLDISKRPDFDSELAALMAFQPKAGARMFPNSVSKLLEKWTSTLDRARIHNPKNYENDGKPGSQNPRNNNSNAGRASKYAGIGKIPLVELPDTKQPAS
jgi:hypothetical protein